MPGVRQVRSLARGRFLGVLGVAAIVVGCSSPVTSPAESAAPSQSTIETAGPSAESPSAQPSSAPTDTPLPTTPPGTVITTGFHFDDILKIQVDKLAVHIAPTKTARLVHQYLILGTVASDLGEVRLDKGSFVKVQLGPLQVGDITWYLVWPAANATLDDQTTNWYDQAPLAGQPVPAWIATAVGTAKYVTLERRPTAAEIAAVETKGLFEAGTGGYVSPPMPRHDAFLLFWAIAPLQAGASCAFKVSLAPSAPDFAGVDIASASTNSVKISPLTGAPAAWPEAAAATWDTFTLRITSTCRWAIRLIRLEHD